MKLIASDADKWGWRAFRRLPMEAKVLYCWFEDYVDDYGLLRDPDWDLIVMQTGIDGGKLQVCLNELSLAGLVVGADDNQVSAPRAAMARAEQARVMLLFHRGKNPYGHRSHSAEPTEAEIAIARTIDGWVKAAGVQWGYRLSDNPDFVKAASRCVRLRIADRVIGSQELAAVILMVSEDEYATAASRAAGLHPEKVFTPKMLTMALARGKEFDEALARIRTTSGAPPQCGHGTTTTNSGPKQTAKSLQGDL